MKAIVHDRYGPPDDVLVLKESIEDYIVGVFGMSQLFNGTR